MISNKSAILIIFGIMGISAGVYYFITENNLSGIQRTQDGDIVAVTSSKKALTKNALKGLVSEKKKKVKGLEGKDNPNLFAEWFNGIRTKAGQATPDYVLNYQVDELLKSKKLNSTTQLRKSSGVQTVTWTERGPGNVAGRTRSILVDPVDVDTWIVGSVGGGVWKTIDAGQNWINLTEDLPNLATSALAWSLSNTDIIYAGTGEGFGNVDQIDGSGIWKTVNGGTTWLQLTSTATNPEFENVMRLAVDPDDPDIIVAAVAPGFNYLGGLPTSGIYRSINGGTGWIKTHNAGNNNVEDLKVNPLNFNTQLATVNGTTVIKSTNGGQSWNESGNGIDKEDVGRMELAYAPSDTNKVYISAIGGAAVSILYGSDDGGESWAEYNDINANIDWLGGQGWYDNTIAVHPFNANRVFVGGIQLWQLDVSEGVDKLLTTTNITDGYGQYGGSSKGVHVDHHNLLMVPTGESTFRFFDGNDGGIAFSDDQGSSFSQTGDFGRGDPPNEILMGYNTTQFYGIDKANGIDRYIGGTQDNGSWVSPLDADATSEWVSAPSGDGFEVVWHYGNINMMLESSQYNSISRTLNGGMSWIPVTGIDNGSESAPFFTKIAKSKQNPDLVFVIGKSGVWRSDNFGSSWSLISMPAGFDGKSSFSQIKISLSNPQIVWSARNMTASSPPYVSVDGGLSFNATNYYSQVALNRVSGFETHPTEDSTAFALSSMSQLPKILKTTDLGQTWTDISGFGLNDLSSSGFPDVAVFSLLVMPYNTNIIWAGTEIGIFESLDGGGTWAFAENGFPAVAVYDMLIVNDEIVVATHGRGVWTAAVPELDGYEPPNVILPPRVLVSGGAAGIVYFDLSLPSAYDSTVVIAAGSRVFKLGASISDTDTSFQSIINLVEADTIDIFANSYINGKVYRSGSAWLNVFPLAKVAVGYTQNFSDGGSLDFVLAGLGIDSFGSNKSLHSNHPYSDGQSAVAMLIVPIIVAAQDATLSYDDVSIIEPGETGSLFGDEEFYDYVVVEGSNDLGVSWKTVAEGYDARYNTSWLAAYPDGPGDATMFVNHEIDLLNTFSSGDTILIRFKLFADPFSNGWGWAIDNIKIQNQLINRLDEKDGLPKEFSLSRNYPNPFNPTTRISYTLAKKSDVKIRVFNALGQVIKTLVNEKGQSAKNYEILWDGRNELGKPVSSGLYFYRMVAGSYVKSYKMILLR